MESLTSHEIHQQVRERLADAEVRYTTGRRAVVTALLRARGPRSAGEIVDLVVGAVPISSLYRSLAVLDESGVIGKHHDVDGIARFELAEWLVGHHHHMVCDRCGNVEDVALSGHEEDALHELVDRVGDSLGYTVSGHVLEVEGVCATCAV